MIIQSYARKDLNTNDIAFTIDKGDLEQTLKILEKVKAQLEFSNVFVDDKIAKISIVGAGTPHLAARVFLLSPFSRRLALQFCARRVINTSGWRL